MVDSFTFLVVVSFSAFMFCPLCKAEYRHGFSTCSDCRIPLVATEAEAAAVEVDRLWTGDDRKKFESILDVLLDAGIPFRSRESLKSRPWPWISIFLCKFMKPHPTSTAIGTELTQPFPKQKAVMTTTMRTIEALFARLVHLTHVPFCA